MRDDRGLHFQGALQDTDEELIAGKALLECKTLTKNSNVQAITMTLEHSGLSIEIVGITAVAGLLSSEALKDPKKEDQDISADEAFEFFDVDGDGGIQKGDLEYVILDHY